MSYNMSTAYLSSLIYKEDLINNNTNGTTFEPEAAISGQ